MQLKKLILIKIEKNYIGKNQICFTKKTKKILRQ